MTTLNIPNTFVVDTPADAPPVNANFTAISTWANGNVDQTNISGSAKLPPTILNNLAGTANCRTYGISGSPLQDTTSSGVSSIYVGPWQGNQVAIYDGSANWTLYSLAETSYSVGALSNGVYDVYLYVSGGALEVGTSAWSGNTPPTRSLVSGVWTGTSTTYRLVGCIAVTSNKTLDYTGVRGIWNFQNLSRKGLLAAIPTASWTVSATSFGAADSNTTVGQGAFYYLIGVTGAPPVEATFTSFAQQVTGTGSFNNGIGINSTSATTVTGEVSTTTGAYNATCSTFDNTVGYNYMQQLEKIATHNFTSYGNGNSGLTGLGSF